MRLRAFFVLAFVLAASSALAQQAAENTTGYQPYVGQEGKDVVWVPTPQMVVDKMLDMAKVTAKDFVMDLGSGDGRTVITAAKRGARAQGIEYNPEMVSLSQRNAQAAGVSQRATFAKADLFETDFSKATVVTMFLLPDINLKLRPKILAMKPGTRVVSNTFTMGDWPPDEQADLSNQCGTSYCRPLLWIVPAQASGSYKLPQGELVIKQRFQMISGTLTAEGRTVPIEGRMHGERITFTTGAKTYQGKVTGQQVTLD